MITKVIKLDINKNLYEKIKAKQGDTKSRFLLFQLLDGSMPFNLENRSVRAYMLKPDSTEVFNDLIINNKNTGHCTLELTNQVLAVAGIVKIELMIIENDKKITSSIFELQVDKSINSENSIVSTNEFNALLNGLASLSEYDNYKEKAKKVPELEENIQELGSQLDNIKNGMYISDGTVGNNIKPLQIFSLEYLQQQQIKLLADFFKNIKKGITQTICCQGDSLTYGLDQVSADKRVADTTVLPNGSSNGSDKTRAGVTYPEALQKYLNTALGNGKVNVITRGYCGDFVEGAYNRWTIPSGANLSFFQYGTNDSRASWVNYKGDVKQFIEHYEKLIAREILRGSAVVIISPPRNQTNDVDIFTFDNALERLAKKYNCPFIRGDETMLNYSGDIFSDEVHYNTKGYSVHASRICGSLLSRFEKNIVTSGSKIGTYPNQDNIYLTGNARYFENDQYPTPSQIDTTKGSCIFFENSSITIPFYTNEDDLVLYPSIFINDNCSVDVILDYEVEQSLYSNSDLVEKDKRSIPNNKIMIESTTSIFSNRLTNEDKFILIPKKGWHSVTFKTSATKLMGYYGLEFIDYNTHILLSKFTSVKKSPYYITEFQNSWKNFSDESTSEYVQLYVLKSLDDEIVVRGYIKGGVDELICVLPENFRPQKTIISPCYVRNQSDNSSKIGFVEITENGGVYFRGELNDVNRICINITLK
ncbi:MULTISPECIES: BppU family phage baseplate upper protein [Clostridium]|uniref:BppU family phage baseplate upper protein n=3 Tax=Clostridiaceae TaxID=31979 RepID=UPI0032EC1873